MQKIIHKNETRGTAEHGWLHSKFSFSFAEWYEETRMGFGVIRVLNDDVIEPSSGFPMHPHQNMEIVTIVTSGEVTHEDSIGSKGVVKAGDVQVMSAGTGIVHSEYNNSKDEKLELFQIWMKPKEKNIPPRYDQRNFGTQKIKNEIEILVSGEKNDTTLFINQMAYISRVVLEKDKEVEYEIKRNENGAYVFVVGGEVLVEGESLKTRDAIGILETDKIKIKAISETELFIFDVPMQ
jgi:quercetin 2,3-dioxygenase